MEESQKDERDIEHFKGLYKKNAPSLILFACRFLDRTAAEDVVHDVFLKIWKKRAFLYFGDGIITYLYNSVRHACLDYLKHLDIKESVEELITVQLKIEELSYNDNWIKLYSEDERLTLIYNEIEKLPQKCREIFIMSYIEEKKASEIASLLNISRRTVEAQLYKGLRIIRDALLLSVVLLFG